MKVGEDLHMEITENTVERPQRPHPATAFTYFFGPKKFPGLHTIKVLEFFHFVVYYVGHCMKAFIYSQMDPKQEQHILLWNAFKKGDWDAYTSLYHAYYRVLNNYCYKFTKDVSLIEDAIHDLFTTLWTSRDNLGNPPSVKNYLYKSIRNILFRKIKAESRFFDLQENDESIPFVVSYDHQLILNEDEKRLHQTIQDVLLKLPPRQQEIIHLRFFDGLSYEEIAEIMCINVASAYKLLYKALSNLQQSLVYVGIAITEVLLGIPRANVDQQEVSLYTGCLLAFPTHP